MTSFKTAVFYCFSTLMCCAQQPGSSPPAAPLKPGPPHIVTVETKHLKVEFAGDRAWTIYRILFMGEIVADKVGFYGTVVSEEGGKWIGTGHNEGGVERVETVTLTVNGEARELADKAVYSGKRAEIHKRSTMGPLRLDATYVVTQDSILERHRYEVLNDVKIGTLYAFMHPWIPSTTEWIAEKKDGSLLEGAFDSSGNFKLTQDVKWTSIYNPVSRLAMLAWYPTPLEGQGVKTGYWDKTVYHKLYNQIYSHAPLLRGAKFEASIIIRGVKADAEMWKSSTKTLAEETKERFDAGELNF